MHIDASTKNDSADILIEVQEEKKTKLTIGSGETS